MKALKKLIALFLVLSISILSGVLIYNEKGTKVQGNASDNVVVILDAGHGGFDGGASADDGTTEKSINLQISYKLNKIYLLSIPHPPFRPQI